MCPMDAHALQSFLGMDLSAEKDLLFIVGLLLLVVGLFLAFAGRRIWKRVMSLVGAIIGGLIGFAIGTAVGGILIGFVVGTLASMVGSALFIFLARVGLGLVAGVLAFVVVGMLVEDTLIAGIVAVIAFAVTVAYIEAAMGIVTALVGGLLVGFGLLLLDVLDMTMVVVSLLAVMVLGAAIQMVALRDETEHRRRMRAVGSSSGVAAAAVAPPAAPPMPGRTCPRCGGQLDYIPEYNRYYCFHCQRYE